MSNRLVVALCATLFLDPPLARRNTRSRGAHPNAGVLVIDGSGFPRGWSVGMAGRDLTVLSVTRTSQGRASHAASGSYRLTLKQRFTRRASS